MMCPGGHQLADVVVLAALGGEDRAEALRVGRVVAGEELELVHPLQVEEDAALAAVDLEVVVVLAARGEAGGLEGAQRAVGELHGHEGGVLHGDSCPIRPAPLTLPLKVPDAASSGSGRLRDELGRHAADLLDVPDEVAGQVHAVRVQVSLRSGAGELLLQVPGQREVRVHDPGLQVGAAPVEDPADPALVDQLLRQAHRRAAAVVVVDVVRDAFLLGQLVHLLRLLRGSWPAASRRRCACPPAPPPWRYRSEGTAGALMSTMSTSSRWTIFFQSASVFSQPQRSANAFRDSWCRAAGDLQHGLRLHVEEQGRLLPGVGVGLAHELVADDPDVQLLHDPPPTSPRWRCGAAP